MKSKDKKPSILGDPHPQTPKKTERGPTRSPARRPPAAGLLDGGERHLSGLLGGVAEEPCGDAAEGHLEHRTRKGGVGLGGGGGWEEGHEVVVWIGLVGGG